MDDDDGVQFQSSLDVLKAMFANQEGVSMDVDGEEEDEAAGAASATTEDSFAGTDTSEADQNFINMMLLQDQLSSSSSRNLPSTSAPSSAHLAQMEQLGLGGLNLSLEAILAENKMGGDDDAIMENEEMEGGEEEYDDEEKIQRDALKLFNQAMAYQTKIGKNGGGGAQASSSSSSTSSSGKLLVRPKEKLAENGADMKVRRYTKYERAGPVLSQEYPRDIVMSFPRTKYDVDSTSFFDKNINIVEQTKRLQKKLEDERLKVFNEQIKKDVERLLSSANKIYGQRMWTELEKKDFEKYCKILRTKGTLTHEEKEELKSFYAKAYNLKEVRNVFGEKDYVFVEESQKKKDAVAEASPLKLLKKDAFTSQSSKTKLVNSLIERLQKGASKPKMLLQNPNSMFATSSSSSSFTPSSSALASASASASASSSASTAHIGFCPSAKLSAEKEFRIESIEAFETVMSEEPKAKKRGRPPKRSADFSDFDFLAKEQLKTSEELQREEQIAMLLNKANEAYGYQKKWTEEEKKEFAKFYEIFKDKQNFTLIQSKELQAFYKRAFGKMEKYELEREHDARLLEKKKYWQEYRRQYYLNRKAGIPIEKKRKERPVEDEAEKRKRKAAYLREWRIRKAQEKQDLLNMLLTATLPQHANK